MKLAIWLLVALIAAIPAIEAIAPIATGPAFAQQVPMAVAVVTAASRRKRRASPKGPGYTISTFAIEVGVSPAVIRSAVKANQIRAVVFSGVLRIPPSELDRFRAVWGEAERPAATPASAQQQYHVEHRGLPEPAA